MLPAVDRNGSTPMPTTTRRTSQTQSGHQISKWIAYSKVLDSQHALFVYSIADGKAFQLTDGMSDSISPAFTARRQYLYFLASTDYGPDRLAPNELARPSSPSRHLSRRTYRK
jgi:Tol biopolymer transport system component